MRPVFRTVVSMGQHCSSVTDHAGKFLHSLRRSFGCLWRCGLPLALVDDAKTGGFVPLGGPLILLRSAIGRELAHPRTILDFATRHRKLDRNEKAVVYVAGAVRESH